MKSWKIPTPDDVNRAVALISHPQHYRYFFDRLENPEWIGPLKSKGFFDTPPELRIDEKAGTITTPPWPPSRYLSRMAGIRPEAVFEVILHMPATKNAAIHDDLIAAVLLMPPELAAKLISQILEWVQSPRLFILPDKLGSLVAHLARGGQGDAALDLARTVLAVLEKRSKQPYLAAHPNGGVTRKDVLTTGTTSKY